MPNQSEMASHCVVQWEDNKDQYAIVDTKRSKTVAILKVGVTTLFEGYNRERRRGKILYLGSKKDCFTFGFEIVETDDQLNTYSWGSPPGLREKLDEVVQGIRGGGSTSSFERTASTSSISLITTAKKRKLTNKNCNNIDEITVLNDTVTTKSPSAANKTTDEAIHSIANNVVQYQEKNINNNVASMSSSVSSNIEPTTAAPNVDTESLLKENASLREKVMNLQDELLYQRETSIGLPSEETYDYLKSICASYERVKSSEGQKAIEIGKRLPCTSVELKLAKKTNPSATINNLVKYCFKNIDLKNMCYEKLKENNQQLLEHIHKYVQYVHAPTKISRTMFSSAVSLKCRHLRDTEKHKRGAATKIKEKNKQVSRISDKNNKKQSDQVRATFDEISIEETDADKENIDDNF